MFDCFTGDYDFSKAVRLLGKRTEKSVAIFRLNGSPIISSDEIHRPMNLYEKFSAEKLTAEDIHSSIAGMIFSGERELFLPFFEERQKYAYFCPLLVNEIPVAILGVSSFAESEGSRSEAQAIAQAARKLYLYYQKQSEIFPESGQDLVSQCIAKEIFQDGHELGTFFEMLASYSAKDYPIPGDYMLACIRPEDTSDAALALRLKAAFKDLKLFLPKIFLYREKDTILALLYGIGSSLSASSAAEQMCLYLEKHAMICGMSSSFSLLSERRYFKRQAFAALTIGEMQNSNQRLFLADSMFLDILNFGALQVADASALELFDIEVLEKYDRENNSAYLDTLKVYFETGCNKSLTAEHLFISRGTLIYRLNKIEGLLGLSVDSPENANILKLGIAVHSLSAALRSAKKPTSAS